MATRRIAALLSVLLIAGCAEPDDTAQPAATPTTASPSPTPYVTPTPSPEPTPDAVLADPVGGKFCTEIKLLAGPDPLDPAHLIRVGTDGEKAKNPRIRSQGTFVRESAERAKAQPGPEAQKLLRSQVGRADAECFEQHYYRNPTRR